MNKNETIYFVTMLVRGVLNERLEDYKALGWKAPDDAGSCIDALCAHLYEGMIERYKKKEE